MKTKICLLMSCIALMVGCSTPIPLYPCDPCDDGTTNIHGVTLLAETEAALSLVPSMEQAAVELILGSPDETSLIKQELTWTYVWHPDIITGRPARRLLVTFGVKNQDWLLTGWKWYQGYNNN